MPSDQSSGVTEREGTLVEVHPNIGKEGCIVELRPEEHDTPADRDMEHLTRDEARELHRQLSMYLASEDLHEFVGHVADDLLYLMAPEDVYCDFSDRIDAAQASLRYAQETEPAVPIGDNLSTGSDRDE